MMRQKNFFLLGIFVVGAVVAIFFLQSVYVSWQSEILQLQTETKKLQIQKKFLSDFTARVGDPEEFLNLSEENFLIAREFLPTEPEQEKFTNEVYRVAEKNNIAVTSLQVEEPVTLEVNKNVVENFFRQSIKIQFSASYTDLLNFIREVSDGERFTTLANISIEADEEILSCDAEFFIYFAKLSEE